jgi:HlyD family secretion protein
VAKQTGLAAAIGASLRRHPFWCLAAGLAVLGGGGFLWWRARSQRPQYVTATVTLGSIQRSVSMTGALNPVVTVQVGSYVSGTIKTLKCDYNTEVEIGQVCATIDPVPFQLIVDQDRAEVGIAEAQLRKDRAALVYAKTAFERDSKLLAEGTVAQEAVDNDKSAYDQTVAQIGLDQATILNKQATLKAAAVNLAYTNIVSPVVGTVITRSIDVGQTVAASLQTPTLFLIGKDLTRMQVDSNVSEADVGAIRVGQNAFFSVQAFPGKTFRGRVRQIRHGPITVQNVVTYDVVIAVDNPDRLLFPGMTADTHIVIDEHANVLRVPLPAVRFNPGGIGRSRAGAAGRGEGGGERGAVRAESGGSEGAASSAGEARPAGVAEGSPERSPIGRTESGGAGAAAGVGEPAGGGGAGTEGGHWRRRGRGSEGTGEGRGEARPEGGRGGRGEGPGGRRGAGTRERWGEGRPAGAGERADGAKRDGRHSGRPGGGGGEQRSRVWVLRSDGTLEAVQVVTGLDDGALIEVSGADLHPGDKVVVNEISQGEPRRSGQPPGSNQVLRQGGPRL